MIVPGGGQIVPGGGRIRFPAKSDLRRPTVRMPAPFTVRKDVRLVCCGREPSAGLADKRFIVAGDKNCPDVRVLPGFLSERTVVYGEDQRSTTCCCSVRETPKGPLFVVQNKAEDDDLAFLVAGRLVNDCGGAQIFSASPR